MPASMLHQIFMQLADSVLYTWKSSFSLELENALHMMTPAAQFSFSALPLSLCLQVVICITSKPQALCISLLLLKALS